MALDTRELDLQAKITVRLRDVVPPTGLDRRREGYELDGSAAAARDDARPVPVQRGAAGGLPVRQRRGLQAPARRRSSTTSPSATRRCRSRATLDALKAAGFHWATRAGVTIAIDDVVTPPEKAAILDKHEKEAEKIEKQFQRGVITDDERRQELIEIWTKATAEVARAMEANFPKMNPVFMMVNSGARGNMMQVRQIAGMRGLVANPKGEIIPRPIKANFREGLTVLEYFISTHGARKGLADTALRTADSGYLTRRLVDVSQDVIIREEDCGTERGIPMRIAAAQGRRAGPRPARRDRRLRAHARRGDRRSARQRRPGRHRPRRPRDQHADRGRRRGGQGPLRPDLRGRGRHLRDVLRPLAGRRQARRRRRGGRHHRRPVDRRARHAADHADVPHRRCRG